MEIESVSTIGDWEITNIIEKNQKVEKMFGKDIEEQEKREKKKENRIEVMVLKISILIQKVDSTKNKQRMFEAIKLRQKPIIHKLLEEFP